MKMNLEKLKEQKVNWSMFGKAGNFLSRNVASLSAIGSFIAFGLALYSAFKASDEVSEIHKKYEEKVSKTQSEAISEPEKAKKIKELKMLRNIHYVDAEKWTILSALVGTGLGALSYHSQRIEIVGLGALAYSQRQKLQSIAENAKKMIGEEKFKEIENASLEDLILRNFIEQNGESKELTYRALLPQGSSKDSVVFLDTESGALFVSTEKDMLESFEWANDQMARGIELTQDKWCEHAGYPKPDEPINKCRAWNPKKNPFKAHIGTRDDLLGMTLRSIEFDNKPQPIDKSGVPWKD